MGVCRRESSLFGRFPMKFFSFIITLFLFQSNIMCNSCHKSKRCFFVTLVWASKSQAVSVEKAVKKKNTRWWCGVGAFRELEKETKIYVLVFWLFVSSVCACWFLSFFLRHNFCQNSIHPYRIFVFFCQVLSGWSQSSAPGGRDPACSFFPPSTFS